MAHYYRIEDDLDERKRFESWIQRNLKTYNNFTRVSQNAERYSDPYVHLLWIGFQGGVRTQLQGDK